MYTTIITDTSPLLCWTPGRSSSAARGLPHPLCDEDASLVASPHANALGGVSGLRVDVGGEEPPPRQGLAQEPQDLVHRQSQDPLVLHFDGEGGEGNVRFSALLIPIALAQNDLAADGQPAPDAVRDPELRDVVDALVGNVDALRVRERLEKVLGDGLEGREEGLTKEGGRSVGGDEGGAREGRGTGGGHSRLPR